MYSRRAVLLSAGIARLSAQTQTRMFQDAEAYERFMGRWSQLVAPALVDFADLPASGRVLDVGSGTGSLAFSISRAKSQLQVVGIDPSKEYVAYAASRNPANDRVSFEVGDAQKLRFPAGHCAACVSLLVFNFIPNHGQALNELRRVTSRGGTISAAVWDYGEGMGMLRVFWDAAVHLDSSAGQSDEKHMPLCRAGELSALWKKHGLRNVTESPLTIQMRFANFADYWDPFLLGQGPAGAFTRSRSAGGREALQVEVRKRLGIRNDKTPFHLKARVWAVKGMV